MTAGQALDVLAATLLTAAVYLVCHRLFGLDEGLSVVVALAPTSVQVFRG